MYYLLKAKIISTPIVEMFGGSTLSVRTAGKDICGNRQPFFTLQLDIQVRDNYVIAFPQFNLIFVNSPIE